MYTSEAIAYAGIEAGERFINGEQITLDIDIYAWQACLSHLIPAAAIVSVKQSSIDFAAYTVTLSPYHT